MPSTARQARFAPIPASYSRLPHDDEIYVMKAFARHSAHCSTCSELYAADPSSRSLCSKGLKRALDVTQYVFNKGGLPFSVVDLESNQRCQVEIPADCDAVRQLLKAIERGLRLRPSSSSSSASSSLSSSPTSPSFSRRERLSNYDQNDYVSHRHISPERDLAHDLKYANTERQSRYPRKSTADTTETYPRYVTSTPRRFASLKQRPTSYYYESGSRGKQSASGRNERYY